jgi:hypothetical protein
LRDGLALVGRQVHHPQARVFLGECIEDAAGLVAAAVVDGDDLEVRVLGCMRVVHGVPDVDALVEAGNDDAARRRILDRGRVIHVTVFRSFPAEKVPSATDHPYPGHHQGVEENEVQQPVDVHALGLLSPMREGFERNTFPGGFEAWAVIEEVIRVIGQVEDSAAHELFHPVAEGLTLHPSAFAAPVAGL